MLNSGKKIPEKKFGMKQKTITPLQVKWSVPNSI
jgi:hypothetical protein